MSMQALLSLLADGQFHSGDELGELLGVSRTAVWKQLKKLDELGLALQSVKGKGYRLAGGLDLLSEQNIRLGLQAQAEQWITRLDIRDRIDSTSTRAMQQALDNPATAQGYICTAEQQTAGRGRRGRPWLSPYAANLYLSVVWQFAAGAAALQGLSLAVGVAVVNALKAVGVDDIALKWPNDLLYKRRKLAGVLIEMEGDAAGPCQVVVGIGLNVNMPSDAAIDQPWVDVASINPQAADRNRLLSAILNELMPLLAGFEQQGFAHWRAEWQRHDAFAQQQVVVSQGDERVFGEAVGVDETGALLLQTPAGKRSFNGGEVSLRVAD